MTSLGAVLDSLSVLSRSSGTLSMASDPVTLRSCFAIATHVLAETSELGLNTLQRFLDDILADGNTVYVGKELLTSLPVVLLAKVHSYLGRKELGNLRSSCKQLNVTLQPYGYNASLFWAKEWKHWCLPSDISHASYLRFRLQHEFDELRHWSAIEALAAAIRRVNSPLIIGISGNIGKFPDKRISQAITRRRPQALMGVIVSDTSVCHYFRKVSYYPRALNFMVTEAVDAGAERPPIQAEGFIGYALDLLELREDEEFLRETVLAALVYRDLTVWESSADVRRAIATGAYAAENPFYCVLDDNRPDLEVMDDDAPRTIPGQPLLVSRAHRQWLGPVAPYGRFRPRISEIGNPGKHLHGIQERVAALETAVLADIS